MSGLSAHARRKVQRIFDEAARELLAQFDGDAVAATAWLHGCAQDGGLDDGAAPVKVEGVEQGGGRQRQRSRSAAA